MGARDRPTPRRRAAAARFAHRRGCYCVSAACLGGALRAVPFGTTRTYSEVARSLGRPSATRAVARACATNPTSIVVPCHRVIRTDGSLGGYRWGLHRKQLLLEQELRVAKGGGDSAKRDKAVAATR